MRTVSVFLPFKIATVISLFQASLSVRFDVVSEGKVMASLGSAAVLSCHLNPATDATNMEIRWFRSTSNPYVHLYMRGTDLYTEQMKALADRTELRKQNITSGLLSLVIRNVTVSDSGEYHCFFESDQHHGEAVTNLSVYEMGMDPLISIEDNGELSATCESRGWYPQPTVTWRDSEEKVLDSSQEISLARDTGLFNVRTAVRINTQSRIYCSITNKLVNLEKESAIKIGETVFWRVDRFGKSCFILIAACVVVNLVPILFFLITDYGVCFPNLKKKFDDLEKKFDNLASEETTLSIQKEELGERERDLKKRADDVEKQENSLFDRENQMTEKELAMNKREEDMTEQENAMMPVAQTVVS